MGKRPRNRTRLSPVQNGAPASVPLPHIDQTSPPGNESQAPTTARNADGGQTTEALLAASNEALKITNDLLRKDLKEVVEKQWSLPKGLLLVGSVVFTLVFAKSTFDNFVTTRTLRAELDDAVRKRELMEKKSNELEQTWADAKAKLGEVETQLLTAIDTFESLQKRTVAVDKSAHRIFSLVSLGTSHLHQRKDPSRALHYATLARNEIAEAAKFAQQDQAILDLVNQLASIVWVLQAEAAWQRGESGDLNIVAEAADHLMKLGCNSAIGCERNEGRFYSGIVELTRSADTTESSNESERLARVSKAVDFFRTERQGGEDAAVASLFLGVALFERGDYAACKDELSTFLGRHGKQAAPRDRLSPRTKAELALAEAWLRKADFILGDDLAFEGEFACSIDVGAIGAGEARMFETILERAVGRRSDVIRDESRANTFGLFAVRTIMALRQSAGIGNCPSASSLLGNTSGCPGCEGAKESSGARWRELWEAVPSEFIEEFHLRRATCLRPEKTSDVAFGELIGDRLVLARVVTVAVPVEITLIGGATKRRTDVELSHVQLLSFPGNVTSLPSDRYVPTARFRKYATDPVTLVDANGKPQQAAPTPALAPSSSAGRGTQPIVPTPRGR